MKNSRIEIFKTSNKEETTSYRRSEKISNI